MPHSTVRASALVALLAASVCLPAQAQVPDLSAMTALPQAADPSTPGVQDADSRPAEEAEKTGPAALDSHFCAQSFFTNEGDALDLRSPTGAGCFDTGRGRDVFRINPGDFPEGVAIFSDRGRSLLDAGDSPALVFDQEATAEEIKTGPGNDTIRLGLSFVRDGLLVNTPQTLVYPGGGENLVVIGSGRRNAQAARVGANTRIVPGPGTLALEAGCGRMMDADTVDATIEGAPAGARVFVDATGCGVGVRDHAGSLVFHQEGGRTAVAVGHEGGGEGPLYFDATIEDSAGLSWNAYEPRADSVLDWSGFGSAALHLRAQAEGTGGGYRLHGDGTVFVRAQVEAGRPEVDVLASERAEVVVEGGGTGRARILLSAPDMRVEWRASGAATPPQVQVGSGGEIEAQPFQVKVKEGLWNPGALASDSQGEPGAEAEAPDGPEQVSVEPTDRDAAGRSAAGRAALMGGHAVGAGPAEGAFMEAWTTEPVFVASGALNLVLVPAPGWCKEVVIEGGIGNKTRRLDCAGSGRVDLRLSDTITIVGPDGVGQEWRVEGREFTSKTSFEVAAP